jgi:hypothetical protein
VTNENPGVVEVDDVQGELAVEFIDQLDELPDHVWFG